MFSKRKLGNKFFFLNDIWNKTKQKLSYSLYINIFYNTFKVFHCIKALLFIKISLVYVNTVSSSPHLIFSVRCILLLFSLYSSMGLSFGSLYLAKDQQRLGRVQHKFVSYAAFILKLPSLDHNSSDISRELNIPPLSSRRNHIGYQFIIALHNSFIDAPDLLSQVIKVNQSWILDNLCLDVFQSIRRSPVVNITKSDSLSEYQTK